jgi:hypothetical protein
MFFQTPTVEPGGHIQPEAAGSYAGGGLAAKALSGAGHADKERPLGMSSPSAYLVLESLKTYPFR